jgi:Sec-independent protein translocase protein TatA
MPVSLQYPTLGKNLGKTLKKLAKTWENQKTVKKLAETKKTLEKPAKTLENQKKAKNLGKPKKTQYF